MERFWKTVLISLIICFVVPWSGLALGKPSGSSLSIRDAILIEEEDRTIFKVQVKGHLEDYHVFTLKEPSRIVIDLPHAKVKNLKTIIHSMAAPPVEKVRMGSHPEKVRFVMDISTERIPTYSISRGENWLSVEIKAERKGEMKKEAVKPAVQKEEPRKDWTVQEVASIRPPAKSSDDKPIETREVPAIKPVEKPEIAMPLPERKEQKEEPILKPAEEVLAKKAEPEKEEISLPEKDRRLSWEKGDFKLGLKGYLKTLGLVSKTLDKDRYFLDLNRSRLDLTGTWKETFILKMVYDHEAMLGSFLETDDFRRLKSYKRHDFFDLDWEAADRRDFYWRHYLYRAYLRYQSEKLNLTVGRQRIAWGTGRFWNPTDIFNPFNPVQVERDERLGADVVNAEFFVTPMAGLNLVYAPQDSSKRSKAALKFKSTYKEVDFSVLAGKSERDRVVGGDFAATVFDGGLRGEAVYYFVRDRKNYFQFILNYDYTFKNSFYILIEYLYNSGPLSRPEFLDLIDRGTHTLTRNLIGLNLGYDITPLLRGDLYMIYGPKKDGVFIQPKLKYSLTQNLDVVGGVHWFNQRKGSEFEFDRTLYFLYVHYYF